MRGKCILAVLFVIGLIHLCVHGKPNGAPDQACFYMTPRHIHPHTFRKVYPSRDYGMYNISVSNDFYRPDRAVRVTIWGPKFKGFMMVAAEEGNKDWPTGIFFSENNDAKALYCLGRGDTVTHKNNSDKTAVEVLWYGPETTMANQIQFVATVVVNATTYYTDIKSAFLTQDPMLQAVGGEGAGQTNLHLDPWLSGTGTGTGIGTSTGTGTGGSAWNAWNPNNLNTWNNYWGLGNAWWGDLLGMDGMAADGAGGGGGKKTKGAGGGGKGAAKGAKKGGRGGGKKAGRRGKGRGGGGGGGGHVDPAPNPLQSWWDMFLGT